MVEEEAAREEQRLRSELMAQAEARVRAEVESAEATAGARARAREELLAKMAEEAR